MVSLQSFPGPLTSSPLPPKMMLHLKSNYVTSDVRPFRKKKKRPFSSFHCSWENIPALLLAQRSCAVRSGRTCLAHLRLFSPVPLELYPLWPSSSPSFMIFLLATGPLHIPYAENTSSPQLQYLYLVNDTNFMPQGCARQFIWGMGRKYQNFIL